MKLKNWLWLEKEDLANRVFHYSKFRLLVLASAIIGFFVSIIWTWRAVLISQQLQSFDIFFLDLTAAWINRDLINFFEAITVLGSPLFIYAFFFALSFILIVQRKKRAAASALVSLSGSLVFVLLLKELFGRQRPSGCLSETDCLSFPSGHTTLAFYFYGLLDYLVFRFIPLKVKHFLAISAFLFLLALLVSFSRVVLSVHYPSDLIGGFFLGGAWLSLTVLFIDILY